MKEIYALYISKGLSLYLNLFFLLTPFFVLGVFITITEGAEIKLRRRLAFRIALGASAVTLCIFWCGGIIMRLFGITVDAFRAGSGVLLLLTAVSLVLDKAQQHRETAADKLLDLAVVPMAVPITAGPATLGTLMVWGMTTSSVDLRLVTSIAILAACFSIGGMLAISDKINKLLGHSNITILSKITGLILSAIALQMIVVGAKNIWLE